MRSNVTTAVPMLVAGLLLAGLVDCRCPDKPQAPVKPDAEPSAIRARPVYRFPSAELGSQMRRLHRLSRQLRREASAERLFSAGVALKALNEMSTAAGTPKLFVTELSAMKQATRQLMAAQKKKTGQRRDYNAYVERCIACHQKMAKDYLNVVFKLRLDDEKKKSP